MPDPTIAKQLIDQLNARMLNSSVFTQPLQPLEEKIRSTRTNTGTSPRGSKCRYPDCLKSPYFGYLGQKACYCVGHKEPGMVDVKNKRCEHEGCMTRALFGLNGRKARFCGVHRLEGMVDVKNKRCKREGCGKQANYAFPREKATFCAGHRLEGMVDVKNRPCSSELCTRQATYALPGQRPAACRSHRTAGMVDVKHVKHGKRSHSSTRAARVSSEPRFSLQKGNGAKLSGPFVLAVPQQEQNGAGLGKVHQGKGDSNVGAGLIGGSRTCSASNQLTMTGISSDTNEEKAPKISLYSSSDRAQSTTNVGNPPMPVLDTAAALPIWPVVRSQGVAGIGSTVWVPSTAEQYLPANIASEQMLVSGSGSEEVLAGVAWGSMPEFCPIDNDGGGDGGLRLTSVTSIPLHNSLGRSGDYNWTEDNGTSVSAKPFLLRHHHLARGFAGCGKEQHTSMTCDVSTVPTDMRSMGMWAELRGPSGGIPQEVDKACESLVPTMPTLPLPGHSMGMPYVTSGFSSLNSATSVEVRMENFGLVTGVLRAQAVPTSPGLILPPTSSHNLGIKQSGENVAGQFLSASTGQSVVPGLTSLHGGFGSMRVIGPQPSSESRATNQSGGGIAGVEMRGAASSGYLPHSMVGDHFSALENTSMSSTNQFFKTFPMSASGSNQSMNFETMPWPQEAGGGFVSACSPDVGALDNSTQGTHVQQYPFHCGLHST